jgi:3-hydroxyisobutyrate dehydrogenase
MSTTRVGFIGLGNMGMPMAKSLMKNGFPLTAFDLRQDALKEIETLGGTPARSCKEVAVASDVVFSMVRDVPQTDEVIFGKEGIWEGLEEGKTIVISSSIGPAYCRELYGKAKLRGVSVIDCGVSDPTLFKHELGVLTLMIGGDEDAVKNCWPIFEALGKNIFRVGGIGNGQAYKLVNNIVARYMGVINRAFLIECLNLGLKVGLDLQGMIDVMSVSAGARMLQNMGLRQGLSSQQIFDILNVSAPVPSGPEQHQKNELDYGREMAEEAGVEMPICQFIEAFDVFGQYDKYFSLRESYKHQ